MKLLEIYNNIMMNKPNEIQVWVSPQNELITVEDHLEFLKNLYDNHRADEIVDSELHNKAYEEGWGKYHIVSGGEINEITIAAYNKKRGAEIMRKIFNHVILKYKPAHITFVTTKFLGSTREFMVTNSAEIERLKIFIENN